MTKTLISSDKQEIIIGFDAPFCVIGERIRWGCRICILLSSCRKRVVLQPCQKASATHGLCQQ